MIRSSRSPRRRLSHELQTDLSCQQCKLYSFKQFLDFTMHFDNQSSFLCYYLPNLYWIYWFSNVSATLSSCFYLKMSILYCVRHFWTCFSSLWHQRSDTDTQFHRTHCRVIKKTRYGATSKSGHVSAKSDTFGGWTHLRVLHIYTCIYVWILLNTIVLLIITISFFI